MRIRPAGISDLEAIQAIDPVARHDSSRTRLIERAVRDGRGWVADAGAGVAGFALLGTFFGRPFIELVCVAEGSRRRGVGTALVHELRQAAGGGQVFTSTNVSNRPMQALLTCAGFRLAGVIHDLDPGDPELVFVSGGAKGDAEPAVAPDRGGVT
jgi:ribosomal protein S18 acetylase RimI-like enzyme